MHFIKRFNVEDFFSSQKMISFDHFLIFFQKSKKISPFQLYFFSLFIPFTLSFIFSTFCFPILFAFSPPSSLPPSFFFPLFIHFFALILCLSTTIPKKSLTTSHTSTKHFLFSRCICHFQLDSINTKHQLIISNYIIIIGFDSFFSYY